MKDKIVTVACPWCGARPSEPCAAMGWYVKHTHPERKDLYRQRQKEKELRK
jgi:hypothetical protein